ncbi:MAG: hypothetical protein ABSG86_13890 [Thermoguttaceae bacterium]|jgi:hypothetical protein
MGLPDPGSPSRARRALGLKLGAAIIVLAAIVAGHALVLRMLARPLVSEQPPGAAAVLCLQGDEDGVEGDRTLDEAARWCREAPGRQVLLLEPWPRRVVELGIVPSFEQMVRRELTGRNISNAAIVTLRGKALDDWERARLLRAWLEQNPAAEVVMACGRFHSGRIRYVFDAVLGRPLATRVRIRPVADPDYDPAYWWRSRQGVKDVMFGWLGLAYAWGEGPQRITPSRWTAAEYQSLARETFGKAP